MMKIFASVGRFLIPSIYYSPRLFSQVEAHPRFFRGASQNFTESTSTIHYCITISPCMEGGRCTNNRFSVYLSFISSSSSFEGLSAEQIKVSSCLLVLNTITKCLQFNHVPKKNIMNDFFIYFYNF